MSSTLVKAAAADLKSFIERLERIAAERKDLADDAKEVLAGAKAGGFDTKIIRAIIKRRAADPHEVAEAETIFDTYMVALGMAVDVPLHEQVRSMGIDTLAREQVIETLQLLVPTNGEIIARVGGAPMRLWRDEAGGAHAEEYVPPAAAPKEKTGGRLKSSATVLTMVPKDPVKDAADRAERRGKRTPVDADEEEPVE